MKPKNITEKIIATAQEYFAQDISALAEEYTKQYEQSTLVSFYESEEDRQQLIDEIFQYVFEKSHNLV